MALVDELSDYIRTAVNSDWSYKSGQSVPETKDIGLGNVGTKIDSTVLYADLDDSTKLVDKYTTEFCGSVYKSFLYLSTKIIRSEGGHIRSFDGDRVMGLFFGDAKNSSAARAGLKINHAVSQILNPTLQRKFKEPPIIRHTVGIDTSQLVAVRAGIRGTNDLAWIGRAANYAAKLNSLSADFPTRITKEVFDRLSEDAKYGGTSRDLMWTKANWSDENRTIYRSKWRWKP